MIGQERVTPPTSHHVPVTALYHVSFVYLALHFSSLIGLPRLWHCLSTLRPIMGSRLPPPRALLLSIVELKASNRETLPWSCSPASSTVVAPPALQHLSLSLSKSLSSITATYDTVATILLFRFVMPCHHIIDLSRPSPLLILFMEGPRSW
jgi:hypothetical protein